MSFLTPADGTTPDVGGTPIAESGEPIITTSEQPTISPNPILTPTSTIDSITADQEAIQKVIEQLLRDWNSVVFPDTWDDNITTVYHNRYIGSIFDDLDEMENFFGGQNRRIKNGDITFLNWREGTTRVTARMIIQYGYNIPPDECEHEFEMIKIDDAWYVDGDTSIATEGTIQLCPGI